MLPPRIVRRLVLAPLLIAVTVAVIVTLPLLLGLAAVASLSPPGHWRAVRLVWFGAAWLALESAALFACLVLWITSGFGGRLRSQAYQERHYQLIRWFLDKLYGAATRAFRLSVEVGEPEPSGRDPAARGNRPVIVLSRHAGPGDSFLLVHQLLRRYDRRPRIVLKASLQFDPGLDVVINRLPNAFVPGRRSTERRVVQEIRRLAVGLDGTGALVIFPEGGDFTPRRRLRAIQRLERLGLAVEAERARGMANLLAPHPGGALAAIEAAPTADVVFVAHTGLEDLATIGDVWRGLPMRQVVRAQWWRVPADQVPRDRQAGIAWLYDWWELIDGWVTHNRPRPGDRDASTRLTSR